MLKHNPWSHGVTVRVAGPYVLPPPRPPAQSPARPGSEARGSRSDPQGTQGHAAQQLAPQQAAGNALSPSPQKRSPGRSDNVTQPENGVQGEQPPAQPLARIHVLSVCLSKAHMRWKDVTAAQITLLSRLFSLRR